MPITIEQLRADALKARKDGNKIIGDLLGTLITECEMQARRGKVTQTLNEMELIGVIQKLAKNIRKTRDLIAAGQDDRADEDSRLLIQQAWLGTYLPRQLTTRDIEEIAIRHDALGHNVPKIMASLKAEHSGQYDPEEAIGIVKQVLMVEKS